MEYRILLKIYIFVYTFAKSIYSRVVLVSNYHFFPAPPSSLATADGDSFHTCATRMENKQLRRLNCFVKIVEGAVSFRLHLPALSRIYNTAVRLSKDCTDKGEHE